MAEGVQYVQTFRQVIYHDDDLTGADTALNRWLQQKNLVEIIRNDNVIFPEYSVRWVEAWFMPIPKPTQPVPSRHKREQPAPQRRRFFGG